uniref:Uncharacterized protein n=1 Tax=Mucochytrium quahogii TaxID=96639 RepID=A0A7S2RZT9_9STRA|mmetsp:Transcript_34942/g.55892  ORF Transcript_34942/g.55892 Transcript_34942/m.55892 type:complete len:215 (+) Transcript_34942:167-811(+)|eukprot:CAMPEP_0203748342 /NCGR_PEP_ID=MMETSP0098-20131031/3258_1 /ASSEMBLY_ACC=CAM_ASM_000208 /TAXON_ID=96639 /ORGANISM=" , Strain NY0313808BC1" /LENGTH=214 /DNA_ID=CAMNT_0050637061 /DNA_START=119 /DNA_END=763 /DNA_ORIENTATION=-
MERFLDAQEWLIPHSLCFTNDTQTKNTNLLRAECAFVFGAMECCLELVEGNIPIEIGVVEGDCLLVKFRHVQKDRELVYILDHKKILHQRIRVVGEDAQFNFSNLQMLVRGPKKALETICQLVNGFLELKKDVPSLQVDVSVDYPRRPDIILSRRFKRDYQIESVFADHLLCARRECHASPLRKTSKSPGRTKNEIDMAIMSERDKLLDTLLLI